MIAFHLSSRELLHLRSLELTEQLIHGKGLIASRLYDSLDLHLPDLAIKSIEKLCRGVANHGRVAEGTRPSPEGVYSGGS